MLFGNDASRVWWFHLVFSSHRPKRIDRRSTAWPRQLTILRHFPHRTCLHTALLLRVYSVNPDNAEAVRYSPRLKPDPQQRSVAVDEGQLVWECSIDVRDLTAFPAGSRLSHLRILPADCLLVEMSNGGVYAPGTEDLSAASTARALLRLDLPLVPFLVNPFF